jgi:hypothetical protein
MSFNDGVECIINQVICAMREAFDPASSYPPLGGGSTTIRVFAGDATPLAAVDLHINDTGCGQDPFLWVRLARRFRSQSFPQPYVGAGGCASQRVAAVEVGVARCAVIETGDGPDWTALSEEAEVSLDDSGRIELALCRASALMTSKRCSDMQAVDAIVPYGPDGGVIAWIGTIYAAIST